MFYLEYRSASVKSFTEIKLMKLCLVYFARDGTAQCSKSLVELLVSANIPFICLRRMLLP